MPNSNYLVHTLLRARDWQHRPELDLVCDWWRNGGRGICTLVGMGGAGKTAITDRFLQLLPGAYPELPDVPKDTTLYPPSRLFVVSFYDAPNPDAFFEKLAAWLGCDTTEKSGGIPKYHRILQWFSASAQLNEEAYSSEMRATQPTSKREMRSLCFFVFDGLEMVQDDGGRRGIFGKLNDRRLSDLVQRIADGLIANVSALITTRFPIAELEESRPSLYTPLEIGGVEPTSGVRLLRQRGVRGTDTQLQNVVAECGYHALTVDLAGGYIAEFGGCDPNTDLNLGTLAALDEAVKNEPNHRRRRVLRQEYRFARIAQRHREGLKQSNPAALALLERICLFRLGTDTQTLTAVFTGVNKEHVSGQSLARMSKIEIQQILDFLVEARLLHAGESANSLELQSHKSSRIEANKQILYTVHPAIREAFVRGLQADTAKQGHRAVQDMFEASLSEISESIRKPTNSTILDILEEIIHHLIEQDNAKEAFDAYWYRIGNYLSLGARIGAYERGERICRSLLNRKFLPQEITTVRAFFLRIDRALFLYALGRLHDAIALLQEAFTSVRNRDVSSIVYPNLSMFLISHGRLAAAQEASEEGMRSVGRRKYKRFLSAASAYCLCLRGFVRDSHASGIGLRSSSTPEEMADGSFGSVLPVVEVAISAILIRVGSFEKAGRRLNEVRDVVRKRHGNEQHDLFKCSLLLAEIACERRNLQVARELIENAHEWALQRDAKEGLCSSALVRARTELSAISDHHSAQKDAVDECLNAAETSITEGLKIARDCGYDIYHIDLLLERARLHLLRGNPQFALEDLRLALDDGIPANDQTGQPELLAANHEECGYAWAIAHGQHLCGEAQLLQAAQQLGRNDFAPANKNKPPEPIQALINEAQENLNAAMKCWQPLHDPEPEREDQNFKFDGKEYNFRAAETHHIITDLDGGILTRYPLKGPTMIKTVLELDLVGYSTICDLLEEMAGVDAIANLNKEIQTFVDVGLESIGAKRADVVMQETGDGAILVLTQPSDAHQFATTVHEATHRHNEKKSKPVGKRVFRVGAATGELSMKAKDGGGYDLAGMTIARAVRLEGKASPGGLLVDPATYEALTVEQQKSYKGPENIPGKRDEIFSAFRCLMDSKAGDDVAFFLEQAEQKKEAKPIKPAMPGVKKEEKREILKRFEALKKHQFYPLVFLMEIPLSRRPADTLDLEGKKSHILEWAEEENQLEDLLLELREFQKEALPANPL